MASDQDRERYRFAALDLLRGVAALAVLVFHNFKDWGAVPRGFLAVDLFFVLSGFVIAHAYGRRLMGDLPISQFVVVRLVRLYPLYLAATCLAAAPLLASWLFHRLGYSHGVRAGLDVLLATLGVSLLFLPTPQAWSADPSTAFPLNQPAWSLFFELAANLLYALTARILRGRALVLAVICTAAALGVLAQRSGTVAMGFDWPSFAGGLPRALFGFLAGVAVFAVWRRRQAPRLPAWLLALALIVVFLLPMRFGGWPYELACAVLLFPFLVWLGAGAECSEQVRRLARWAGLLSYPIYVLQVPVMRAVSLVLHKAGWAVGPPGAVERTLSVAAVLLTAWLAAGWFDEPVRRSLRRRFSPDVPPAAAQTAP